MASPLHSRGNESQRHRHGIEQVYRDLVHAQALGIGEFECAADL